jgi:site-specific DNA-methyltransferase (adenine-specific)
MRKIKPICPKVICCSMLELNQIYCGDCLELMKEMPDNSVDLLFTDPPYALGSEIIIKRDGKPDYKKAVDFMDKWDMPTGGFWEEWFKEAERVLKYGGHCLVFGMDRQNFMFKYYAHLAGFTGKQSLYWYFISSFPKATDLSKSIDKRFGLEREVVGKNKYANRTPNGNNWAGKSQAEANITTPNHPLAKKYNGYKYSIAPLKQTCEEIMVFQKPYKNKSCLDDVLAYENGDSEITVGALDIDGNRVATKEELGRNNNARAEGTSYVVQKKTMRIDNSTNGRYPAQTFVDTLAGEAIDRQSGVLKSGSKKANIEKYNKSDRGCDTDFINTLGKTNKEYIANSGGASRILHKCDYETTEFDLFNYCPKVPPSERQKGLEDTDIVCNHPTLKPTKLLTKILKLFKTPNQQVVLDPFMGSGSMGISAIETGFDYIGIELNPDYFKIAEARLKSVTKPII